MVNAIRNAHHHAPSTAESKPAVLILIAGLLRTFEVTAPYLLQSVVTPNPSHRFELIVATGLSRCEARDRGVFLP